MTFNDNLAADALAKVVDVSDNLMAHLDAHEGFSSVAKIGKYSSIVTITYKNLTLRPQIGFAGTKIGVLLHRNFQKEAETVSKRKMWNEKAYRQVSDKIVAMFKAEEKRLIKRQWTEKAYGLGSEWAADKSIPVGRVTGGVPLFDSEGVRPTAEFSIRVPLEYADEFHQIMQQKLKETLREMGVEKGW